MKNLLRYYDIEPEVIFHVLKIYPRNFKDEPLYTEENFIRAVESDPRGALYVLADWLGVNWVVFEEQMVEWEHKEEQCRRRREFTAIMHAARNGEIL